LTGSAGATDDIFDAFAGLDVTLLLVTVLAVALLLIITYRSPVLWLLPLLVVGIASQACNAVVYLLAEHAVLTVDFQSQSIVTILVFGVGIDYALLLIARYREALHQHADRHAAMAEALRRSFPAIAASAATVAVGLVCLLAADLPSTRGLGPVGAVGVVAAFAAMMTLLPAVIVLFGRWVFWPFVPRVGEVGAQHRVWRGIAAGVGRRPRTVWVGTAIALVALTFGIGNLSVGLPGDESFTKEVGSVTGQHLVEAHYPSGTVSPAVILASAGSAEPIMAAARGVSGVAGVMPAEVSSDGRWVRVRAVLADAPESEAALSTVDRLRSAVHAVAGDAAPRRGRHRRQPRHRTHRRARQPGGDAAHPRGSVHDHDTAATGDRRAVGAPGQRHPLVRRCARRRRHGPGRDRSPAAVGRCPLQTFLFLVALGV
jgi:RND superfamily putative drug exporter